MSLQEDLYKECGKFGKKIAIYMRANLEEAMQKAGSKNPQETSLRFEPVISMNGSTVNIQIVASDEYWYYVDNGRKAGKMPPPDTFGKKWQAKNNIDPRKVIAEIQLKRKRGLKINPKGSLNTKKWLSFKKASKQLSFIIARSIGKKGVKARPFVENTMKDVEFDVFKKRMAGLIGKEITLDINLK